MQILLPRLIVFWKQLFNNSLLDFAANIDAMPRAFALVFRNDVPCFGETPTAHLSSSGGSLLNPFWTDTISSKSKFWMSFTHHTLWKANQPVFKMESLQKTLKISSVLITLAKKLLGLSKCPHHIVLDESSRSGGLSVKTVLGFQVHGEIVKGQNETPLEQRNWSAFGRYIDPHMCKQVAWCRLRVMNPSA